MIDVLNINMWKVYVNYNTLFIDRRCYTFMLLAQQQQTRGGKTTRIT